jgi:hypothetical protein
MRFKRLCVAAIAVVATVGVGAQADAGRKLPPTSAHVFSPLVIDRHDPTIAYMSALYRCYGEGTLWVSVKQVADRSKDPALREEGSSAISAAWSMSHRNSVNCDGRLHLQRFTLDQVETSDFGIPPSPLKFGWGYIQYCLFDDNYPIPPENPEQGTPFTVDGFRLVL